MKVKRYFEEIEYRRKAKTAAGMAVLVVIWSVMLLMVLIFF
jgi:hypothetical protein